MSQTTWGFNPVETWSNSHNSKRARTYDEANKSLIVCDEPCVVSTLDLVDGGLKLPDAVLSSSSLLQELLEVDQHKGPLPLTTKQLISWVDYAAHFMKDEATCLRVSAQLGHALLLLDSRSYADGGLSSPPAAARLAIARERTLRPGDLLPMQQMLLQLPHDLSAMVLAATPCSLLRLTQHLPPALHPAAVASRVTPSHALIIAAEHDLCSSMPPAATCILQLGPHLARLPQPLLSLGLVNADIGDVGAANLAPSLFALTALTALALSGNRITGAGITALAPYLELLTGLQDLDVGSNWLCEAGAGVLEAPLRSLTALTALRIPRNGIPARGSAALIAVAGTIASLALLDLSHNEAEFDEELAEALEAHLSPLSALATLRLAGAWPGVNAPAAHLHGLLHALPQLRDLDMSGCGGEDALEAAAAMPRLERLAIVDCHLPDAAALRPLLLALAPRLQALDLRDCELDLEQLGALGATIGHLTRLTSLRTGDATEPVATAPLALSLKPLISLAELALSICLFSDDRGAPSHALPPLTALAALTGLTVTVLDTGGYRGAAASAAADLVDALAQLAQLQDLTLQGDGALATLPFLHRLAALTRLKALCLGDLGAAIQGEHSWCQLPVLPALTLLDLSKRVTVHPGGEAELTAAAVSMPCLRTLVLSATRPTRLWDTLLLYGIAVRFGRHEIATGRE